MFTATTLLIALGLDNAAVAASIAGPWRLWLPGAARLGMAALALAMAGTAAGRLIRFWLHGWAQLMGATILFALAVDALREAISGRPRVFPEEIDAPGPVWRKVCAVLAGSLDEFGVGFAFGGTLGGIGLQPWSVSCLVETTAALMCGFALRDWAAQGRKLSPWSAAALFAGCSLLLLAFPVYSGPPPP